MKANKPNISFIPEDELEEYHKNNSEEKIFLMEKEEVYKRINGELIYQDLRWKNNLRPDGVPDEEKPVAEWLNYIEYHLDKAKNYNYHLDKNNSLHELRKVAALAIRALMIHGCPLRDLSGNGGNVVWKNNEWVNSKTGEPVLRCNQDNDYKSSCNCENCECKKKQ